MMWPKENSFPGCTIETGRADSIEAMLWDIPKADGIVGVIVLDRCVFEQGTFKRIGFRRYLW